MSNSAASSKKIAAKSAPRPRSRAKLAAPKPARGVRVASLGKQLSIPLVSLLAASSVADRVMLENEGVPALMARDLFKHMAFQEAEVHAFLNMSKSAYHRRISEDKAVIDGAAGHAIVGYADLLLYLQRQLAEMGDAKQLNEFDAAKWLGQWLREPNAALGGARPATYMSSPTGRNAVIRALGANFSGAYQ
jgi:uncharacterized protein (DUF2384 family)